MVTTRRPTSAPTRYCLDPCHVGARFQTRLHCLQRRIPAESRLPSDTSATGGVPAAALWPCKKSWRHLSGANNIYRLLRRHVALSAVADFVARVGIVGSRLIAGTADSSVIPATHSASDDVVVVLPRPLASPQPRTHAHISVGLTSPAPTLRCGLPSPAVALSPAAVPGSAAVPGRGPEVLPPPRL